MAWNFSSDRPVYLQIADRIKTSVLSGEYLPGEQIPTVRQLALDAAVNPNTVQRAYKELETEGYIYSLQGKGSFVAPPVTGKDNVNRDELYKSLVSIANELAYMGDSKEKLL